jgi:hypothetical protein
MEQVEVGGIIMIMVGIRFIILLRVNDSFKVDERLKITFRDEIQLLQLLDIGRG